MLKKAYERGASTNGITAKSDGDHFSSFQSACGLVIFEIAEAENPSYLIDYVVQRACLVFPFHTTLFSLQSAALSAKGARGSSSRAQSSESRAEVETQTSSSTESSSE